MTKLTLAELACITGGVLLGDPHLIVTSVSAIDKAGEESVTFLSNPKYAKYLKDCKARIVIVEKGAQLANCKGNLLVVTDPYVAFAKIAQVLDTTPKPEEGISSSAVISKSAKLGANVSVGANSVIELGVEISDNAVIGAGCFIGKNAKIGSDTRLWANVTLYHGVIVGKNCLIQSGAVVGADGFGYANESGEWIKIPQIGAVHIGNRVEIGACTTIDRGALDNTVIEDNVVLDNQLQIAHNVHVGYGTAIAGGTIIAGSTIIGKHCTIGGGSVINGHIKIADDVTITGMSMVMRGISEKGVYSSGVPLQPNKKWRKTATLVHRINEMNERIKRVERLFEEQGKKS
ncbi:UDP-3-O-[3-hydroxymyristoyl] glucosamine N-acyltransferase [Candidatus Photodesmus blepharus]|uniref:UDP-3-O-acylglucosamine N-acyltransferase n=1 Tax=Candidatus Photodesmus blepharonis TaxID=1179155 RepID=A0A084CNY4_9GAMM|nr:UDP-3-O-(3-hydroxymyristoyl)glucosamine N-acyltransferase [Candidatus Photodesmus blepharus]KEY91513.1 UDP-3-O-[3-hydroxymyristoyl] glucosamine N-acyltransferase [Candidatus Photodesmus blepharus]